MKNDAPEKFVTFTGKHQCQSLFLTLLKKRLWHTSVFLWIFKYTFLQNTSRRLLRNELIIFLVSDLGELFIRGICSFLRSYCEMSFLARSFVQTFNTQIEIYLELNFRKSSVAEKAFYEVLVLAEKMVYHTSSPLIGKTIFFDHFFVTNEFGCLNFSYLAFLKVNILLILLNHIEKVSELFRYISESVSMKLLSKKETFLSLFVFIQRYFNDIPIWFLLWIFVFQKFVIFLSIWKTRKLILLKAISFIVFYINFEHILDISLFLFQTLNM